MKPMDETVTSTHPAASAEEVQSGWQELKLRVAQLEAERTVLEHDQKSLRALIGRVIEHRQKSHGELVLLLSGLVSKLPINDVGLIVSKLIEHNAHVNEVCAALARGKADAPLPQPSVLIALDQVKRELAAAVKPAVEALIQLEPSLEKSLLTSLITQPGNFFLPAVVRANRCFIKGQLPKERVLREFGDAALIFFNDLTTDAKLNPRPKSEEIVLAFKNDFEALFQQNPTLIPDTRDALFALYQRIQLTKLPTEQRRAQKNAFLRLSFILELLHYYENQNSESPEGVFAQRLPVLIEQLVVAGETIDEKLIEPAESLLAFIVAVDYRLMVVNNIGKAGAAGKTLRYVLRLRAEKVPEQNPLILGEVVPEFVKHLIPPPPQKPPPPAALTAILRLIPPDAQRLVARGIMASDRMRREEAEALGRTLGQELKLTKLEGEVKALTALAPEVERQLAWDKVKDLIERRAEPAAIASAIRDRLHARYDADEVKQSWIILMEADVISLIRTFSQLPYLADGSTDPIARAVMETYVNRLTHEKYAATYGKVVNSLRNMFKAKPDSPTLINFVSLVKWVDAGAAHKLSLDIGLPATT
jgi:hypothetical protein